MSFAARELLATSHCDEQKRAARLLMALLDASEDWVKEEIDGGATNHDLIFAIIEATLKYYTASMMRFPAKAGCQQEVFNEVLDALVTGAQNLKAKGDGIEEIVRKKHEEAKARAS